MASLVSAINFAIVVTRGWIILCHARWCSDCHWADNVPGVKLYTSSHINPVEVRQVWRLGLAWSGTMMFNATFNNILVYRGGQFYSWRKQEYREKTTELPQVTEKLYHIMLYEYTSPWTGFELTTVLMIGTNCKSNCNYHTIMTTTVPNVWRYQRDKKKTWTRGTDDTMAKWKRA